MASLSVTGLEEYQKAIEELGGSAKRIMKLAIYDGAKEIADAVRSRISSLHAEPNIEGLTAWVQKRQSKLTESQKDGLLSGLTLTKMQDSAGETYTKLTFSGYNSTRTRKYPQGQPNIMIAGSIESGTSATKKQPFVRPAVNEAKGRALKAMEQTADAEIKKIMGE